MQSVTNLPDTVTSEARWDEKRKQQGRKEEGVDYWIGHGGIWASWKRLSITPIRSLRKWVSHYGWYKLNSICMLNLSCVTELEPEPGVNQWPADPVSLAREPL